MKREIIMHLGEIAVLSLLVAMGILKLSAIVSSILTLFYLFA